MDDPNSSPDNVQAEEVDLENMEEGRKLGEDGEETRSKKQSRKRTKTGCLSKSLILLLFILTKLYLLTNSPSMSEASYQMWRREADLPQLYQVQTAV